MGDQRAQITDIARRDPDCGDKSGRQQPGESAGIAGIRLHARRRDHRHLEGMSYGDQGDERRDLVVELSGVRRRPQDDRVRRAQVLPHPLAQALECHTTGRECNVLLPIDGGDHGILFVDVQSHETVEVGGRIRHEVASMVSIELMRGVVIGR
jgi:hypothetical protein